MSAHDNGNDEKSREAGSQQPNASTTSVQEHAAVMRNASAAMAVVEEAGEAFEATKNVEIAGPRKSGEKDSEDNTQRVERPPVHENHSEKSKGMGPPPTNGTPPTAKHCAKKSSFTKRSDPLRFAYRNMIQNAESTILMILAKALKEQTDDEAECGRVALLEYKDGAACDEKQFESSDDLRQFLDSVQRHQSVESSGGNSSTASQGNHDEDAANPFTGGDASPTRPVTSGKKRIFIMEDLARNYVEILGSRLHIHPAVFARHWGDLSFLESLDELHTDDLPRFTLPYPHFMNAPKILGEPRKDLEELYRAKFNVRRYMAVPKAFGDWDLRGSIAELESCVSYWGQETGTDGSWDALLLVDPTMRNEMMFIDTPHRRKVSRQPSTLPLDISKGHSCIPNFPAKEVLSPDPGQWSKTEQVLQYDSVFDHIVDLFADPSYNVPKKPFDCTGQVRRLALLKWNEFLNHAIHCLVLTKGEPYSNNGHFSSAISTLWAPTIEEWLLARLVKWSRRLDMERTTVGSIMRSLGINPDSPDDEGRVGKHEATQWRYIRQKLLEYKGLYDDTTASYIQVMGLRESITSNQQARSVGRITLLGSLFVPFSITSGIMSMGGSFLPGEGKFWIFWAVVAPLIFSIAVFLFTDLPAWWRKILGLSKSNQQETAGLPLFYTTGFQQKSK